MDQDSLASIFMDHALGAARHVFGPANARITTPCENGVGSLAINLRPDDRSSHPLARISNELQLVLCMLNNETMALTLIQSPVFTEQMFLTFLDHAGTEQTPLKAHGLQIDSRERDRWQRVIISGFDQQHLDEQAKFVIDAVHAGASSPSPSSMR